MDNTVLQIPMSKTLRDQATAAANDLGFSSLQEYVRVFLTKLAKRQNSISFPETLSEKAEIRYSKMIDDMKSGKEPVYSAKSAEDLLDQLHGRKPLNRLIRSQIPEELFNED
jgi:antitoxin component of RelBE/YafQ-DinJ toxin-antitoxin module